MLKVCSKQIWSRKNNNNVCVHVGMLCVCICVWIVPPPPPPLIPNTCTWKIFWFCKHHCMIFIMGLKNEVTQTKTKSDLYLPSVTKLRTVWRTSGSDSPSHNFLPWKPQWNIIKICFSQQTFFSFTHNTTLWTKAKFTLWTLYMNTSLSKRNVDF